MIRRMSLVELILIQFAGLVKSFTLGFLYLPLIVLYPSIESVGICLIGALASVLFTVALTSIADIQGKKLMISGYLKRFSRCEFYEHQISDYSNINTEIHSEVSNMPFHISGRTFNFKLNRTVRIFVVKRGDSTTVPRQLAAYESMSAGMPSFIYVRDEPDRIKLLGRFFIFHEIGHCSWRNSNSKTTAYLGWRSFWLPSLWAVLSLRIELLSYLVLTLLILVLVFSRPIYNRRVNDIKLHMELSADRFARRFLTRQEELALSSYLQRENQLPEDSSMSESFNLARSEILKDDLRHPPTDVEYIQSGPINILMLAYSVLVLVLGFLSRPPTSLLLYANIALLITVIGVIAWLEYKKEALLTDINTQFFGKRLDS